MRRPQTNKKSSNNRFLSRKNHFIKTKKKAPAAYALAQKQNNYKQNDVCSKDEFVSLKKTAPAAYALAPNKNKIKKKQKY